MISVTRKLEFDAGHRLLKHEGKCRHIHGHRYVAEVSCVAPDLDAVGRVIDFSKIKEIVGGWLDEHWDHGFLAQEGDPIVAWLKANQMKHWELTGAPTAENLSHVLFWAASNLLGTHGIEVVRVRLYETPNCYADCVNG